MHDMACDYDTTSRDLLFVLLFRIIAMSSIHCIYNMLLLARTVTSLIDWQSTNRANVQQVETAYYTISLQVPIATMDHGQVCMHAFSFPLYNIVHYIHVSSNLDDAFSP